MNKLCLFLESIINSFRHYFMYPIQFYLASERPAWVKSFCFFTLTLDDRRPLPVTEKNVTDFLFNKWWWGVVEGEASMIPIYENMAQTLLKKDKDEGFLSGWLCIHPLFSAGDADSLSWRCGKSCISLSGAFGLILLKNSRHFIVLLEPWCNYYSRHTCVRFQVASVNHVIGIWERNFFLVYCLDTGLHFICMHMHLSTHLGQFSKVFMGTSSMFTFILKKTQSQHLHHIRKTLC